MTTPTLCGQVAEKWQNSFARLNRGEPEISGFISFSEAWILTKAFLYPRTLEASRDKRYDPGKVRDAFAVIGQCKMLASLLEDFLGHVRSQFYLVSDDIHQFMAKYEDTSDPQYIGKLVARVLQWHDAWAPAIELGSTPSASFTETFKTQVYAALPFSFADGLKALIATTITFTQTGSPPDWIVNLFPPPLQGTYSRVDEPLWIAFERIGIQERYESTIASVCYEHIERHILETCEQEWDKPMLATIRTWMTDSIVPWMMMPYARGARNAEEAMSMLQGIGSRLDFHLCMTLADLRIQEIFDIIIDYPESQKALEDLKECLQRVDHRSKLVQSLRNANRRRLLHPGAATKTILLQYVSIIRCLRIVDPPGVLLFKVADPIRRYLRERPDTIRCIVASLVGDGESGDSLVDENEPIQPLQQAQVENFADPNWEPEPIDAGPEFRANKPSDIISTLVSIYDSKELFVKELQVLLAQRLLAITDGNFDKERRNLEILKIRFGEAALQVCEVMLKDMTDSKRIDQHIQSQHASDLHPTIISRHFWPPLQAGTFKMPGQFQELQSHYEKEFSKFKPDKKLLWMSHLGTIKLEIEMDDGTTVNADVPPLEAAFIELFAGKDEWTVADLISEVGNVDRASAIRALSTWTDLRLVRETRPDVYKKLSSREEADSMDVQSEPKQTEIVEEPATVLSVQQEEAEQMRVYWRFIEGMLTNLGTLPLDRIQNMLKFAPGYNRNTEQLAVFMEAARRENLVTVKDGMWKLNRQ